MVKDFILNTGDLEIKDGDFLVDYADEQHIESILVANKGDFKQHPLTGVGIKDYLNAPLSRTTLTSLEKQIRLQLKADGFEVEKAEMESNGDINIIAEIIE